MRISECKMDVLSVPQENYILCALSSDLNFKMGLPKQINRKFNLKERIFVSDLEPDDFEVGGAIQFGNLMAIFTKESVWDTPEEDDIIEALMAAKSFCEEDAVFKLAMPKICTGKNGLPWEDVRSMIEFVFDDMDIDILVCEV